VTRADVFTARGFVRLRVRLHDADLYSIRFARQ